MFELDRYSISFTCCVLENLKMNINNENVINSPYCFVVVLFVFCLPCLICVLFCSIFSRSDWSSNSAEIYCIPDKLLKLLSQPHVVQYHFPHPHPHPHEYSVVVVVFFKLCQLSLFPPLPTRQDYKQICPSPAGPVKLRLYFRLTGGGRKLQRRVRDMKLP